MKRALLLLLFALPLYAQSPALSDPNLSPDGRELAFVSGGDIWVAPARGGAAHLLVSNPATESRPLYSPDGKKLAFISDRTGNGDIYVLDLGSGALTRVTYDSTLDQLDAWSRDGEWLYFSSSAQELGFLNDIYRVRATGGTPMPVSNERYVNEFFAAPSPDGKSVAFAARGSSDSEWWRHGHSHVNESELWLRTSLDASSEYKQLTPRGSKHLWPMWSSDGLRIFYAGDEGGAENLWSLDVATQKATKLTTFTNGRVLWPSITGDTIVFERDFGIWSFDTKTNVAAPIAVSLRGVATGAAVEHRMLTRGLDELAVSRDGKKIAFIVHGEVFAAPASDGTNARRITSTAAGELGVTWSPDGRKLAYASDRNGTFALYLFDFATNAETQLTTSAKDDYAPHFSPDGKQIAYLRDGRELHVLTIGGDDSVLVGDALIDFTPPLQAEDALCWSPDGKWIAYLASGERLFRNVWVVPAAGGSPRPLSFLGNTFAGTLSWSSDGKALYYSTSQRTEPGNIARIDLVPRVPKFREQEFRDLFPDDKTDEKKSDTKESAAAAPALAGAEKKPAKADTEIVFDAINRRLHLLPVGLNVSSTRVSPDGKWVAFIASAAGQSNLYVYSLDELAKEPAVARQLTSTAGSKSGMQWSGDSKDVWLLDDTRPVRVAVEDGKAKSMAVSAEMDVDFDQEKGVMFRQAWRWLLIHYHDAKMNGVDWNAVRAELEPRVEAAHTYEEVRGLLRLMIGELNSSHLGVFARGERSSSGRIGLRFERAAVERDGRFVVSEVVPLSPAAITRTVKAGDTLVAVDGVLLGKSANLEQLLDFKTGKEVRLTIESGGARKDVEVQPVNTATERQLVYRAWVERNRDYVRRISNGRIGYVHIADMTPDSLTQLYVDLDAENQTREGVVIDIRNNLGGFVNAYALDVFTRRPYLNMTLRGRPTATARTVLGQRALQRPTVLVTNQHTVSDAENFTEGYRALGLGKVVGEPTAGEIIFTAGRDLIDGTGFGIPYVTVTTDKGEPMEMHPRPVDIPVTRALGEDAAGKDSQLDVAVKMLLK